MPRNNMPAGWQPPAPAWESVWRDTSDPLVAGYFGIQAEASTLLDNWAATAFSGANAPLSVERAHYRDQYGISNFVYIAYWRESQYRQWWEIQQAWWAAAERLEEEVGYWREIISMPFERFETLHSSETPHGIGTLADEVAGPILEHGYPGGARDRIPLSAQDDLKSSIGFGAAFTTQIEDHGRRVRIIPPEKMCVIRSGQNWSFCGDEEKSYYLENVHPVLQEGMVFLRDNPRETNCYVMRFMDQKDRLWLPLEQSFGLGYAADIYGFENWAKSHPTHLAIFGSFMKLVETFGEDMRLMLWHEISVLPGEGCEFEYLACHPQTGLLGYA